ncbi:hypothetical protein Kisp01_24340 [Kineosporia sp. NBRC 101677]|uniref:putative bifunctional diguanylate cyclase/phosphodiesterase n=1 Tax=Kineosporia sp. NBRC 101677 TaxID=3032197 RepID=UPI0024A3649D|nr:GGDEF domain-containing phosphodiesterase [Kineosporia sp. NBRC 101677]GLY15419.1 hypothetical protein Kisp01_24340 [Kineosporia sp. NBRC 101677]
MVVGWGLLATALLLCTAPVRSSRARREDFQRWLTAGAATIVVSVLLACVLTGLVDSRRAALVLSVGTGLACGLLYQAMISWLLARTGMRASTENANTAGALLVLMAIGNLVHDHPAGPSSLAFWQLQADMFAGGTAVTALGTALWIAVLARLGRERRMRLTVWTLTFLSTVSTVNLLSSGFDPVRAAPAWLLAAALLLIAARMKAPACSAEPAVPLTRSSIFGSLIVLFAGTLTLAAQIVVGGDAGVAVIVLVVGGTLLAGQRMVAMVGELTDLTRSRHQALTDELTGIANRRSLLAAVDEAVEQGGAVALMIIDLDRFKEVNDRYGHATGDQVLRHATQTFERRLPPEALLARLGGDEFAVLVPDTHLTPAVEVAEQLLAALTPLQDDGRLLEVGASIGVARLEPGLMSGGELLRRADVAMYQAKVSGLGVRAYDRGLDAAARERRELLEDLGVALRGPADNGQIVLHFQPQMDVWTGAVVGVEALVRWQHPRLGLLSPDRFLDIVENNDLMPALTGRVMRMAVEHGRHWQQDGRQLRISVNLSASCLTEPALLPTVDEILLAGHVRPQDLLIEVTETSLMTNREDALAALQAISARGVGLSIDDYGTGYSSLSYMNILPATELKIDRSFTRRVVEDERTAAIVAGTAELAHRLGMRLVAEGTEDEAALRRVRELGCDISQGYLHSRPLPPEAFGQWLTDQSNLTQAAAYPNAIAQ